MSDSVCFKLLADEQTYVLHGNTDSEPRRRIWLAASPVAAQGVWDMRTGSPGLRLVTKKVSLFALARLSKSILCVVLSSEDCFLLLMIVEYC